MKIRHYMVVLLMTLLCVLWIPNRAFGQDVPASDVSDVSGTSKKTHKDAHGALRGFSEFGMGTLIGTAVAGSALVTGVVIETKQKGKEATYFWPILVAGLVYPVSLAAGSYLGGYLTDTKARKWTPFVGAYAGALVGDALAYLLVKKDHPVVGALFALVMPIIGTVTAMEISHAREKGKKKNSGETITTLPLTFSFVF